jgi:ABC-type multidrug transport system fused ATPase/permease subunit
MQSFSEDAAPVDNAGLFSYIFFTWLTPTVSDICDKKKRSSMVLPPLSERESVTHCFEHMNACNSKNPTLGKALFRSIRGIVIVYFVVYCFWMLSLFAESTIILPLFIAYLRFDSFHDSSLLNFRAVQTPILELPGNASTYINSTVDEVFVFQSLPSFYHGLLIALLLFVMDSFRCFCYTSIFSVAYRVGQRLRAGINGLIINKVIRLKGGKGAKTGELLNIVSADGDRLVDSARAIGSAIVPLLGIFLCWIIGFIVIGWPSLIGNGIITISIPIFLIAGKLMVKFREEGSAASGKRIELLSEILASIRLLKMFAWEESFLQRVKKARKEEAHSYFKMNTSLVILFGINTIIASLASIITFSSMFYLGMEMPSPAKVFMMISLWNAVASLLRLVPLGLAGIANLKTAVTNCAAFLKTEELVPYVQINSNNDEYVAEITNADLSWNSEDESVLKEINLFVRKGEVVCLTGAVGCGKSSIFGALTNQMVLQKGSVRMSNDVSYAPQEPWLMAGTVQENILFGLEYDFSWYKSVTESCGLLPDFEQFDQGDQTCVGQEGVALSGGQRARIGLARAIYRKPSLVILDDPLSAVDRHVAKLIWNSAIRELLRDQDISVLMATHQLIFISEADRIYHMEAGRISETGTPETVLTESTDIGQRFKRFVGERSYSGFSDDVRTGKTVEKRSKNFSCTNTGKIEGRNLIREPYSEEPSTDDPKEGDALLKTKKEKDMQEVRPSATPEVYGHLIKKGSGLGLFLFMLFTQFVIVGFVQGTIYWMGIWMSFIRGDMPFVGLGNESVWLNNNFYMLGFLVAGLGIIIATLAKSVAFSIMIKRIVDELIMSLVSRLLKTKQRFFDVKPKGEIMARLSKDAEEVETYIPMLIDNFFISGIILIFITVFVSISLPWFALAFFIAILAAFNVCRRGCQAMDYFKRLDLLSRSPWYSHTISVLSGLPIIRVFKREIEVINKFYELHDQNSLFFYLFFCSCRWLTTRCDIISVFLTSSIGLFLIFSASGPDSTITPDIAGSILAMTLQISALFQMTFRIAVEANSRMASASSILHYTKNLPLEESSDPINPKSDEIVTSSIILKNVSLRYRQELPRVLRNLDIVISKGENVGVVGRTGSGKSSLFAALFHLSDAVEGEIIINGRSTKNASLKELRKSLALIPQDPTLFGYVLITCYIFKNIISGTIRFNMDPEDKNTDEELLDALKTCGLDKKIEVLGGLKGLLERGGTNLSVGERQLFW